jgi:carbonyl reductase 1
LQYPKSSFNTGSLLIYLTARDQSRGEEALKVTLSDADLKSILSSGAGPVDVAFHSLDITDDASVNTFVDHLRKTHSEGIDIVINNAGIAMNGFGTSNGSKCPPPPRTLQRNIRAEIDWS